jgi:hypothetical protein
MENGTLSIRFTDEELNSIADVVETASKTAPVDTGMLLREAVRRGLRSVLISALNKDPICSGLNVMRSDAFSIASPLGDIDSAVN